jgi:hypothetical protein
LAFSFFTRPLSFRSRLLYPIFCLLCHLFQSVMLFYSVILSVYSVILSEAGSSQRELRAQSKDPGNVCATVITARHSPRAPHHRPPFDWTPSGGVSHATRTAHSTRQRTSELRSEVVCAQNARSKFSSAHSRNASRSVVRQFFSRCHPPTNLPGLVRAIFAGYSCTHLESASH